jgi:hypothetical protein
MGKVQGGGKSRVTWEVIWEDMLGNWGVFIGRQITIVPMHLKREYIWLSFKIKKQLSCKYMGGAKGNIWVKVLNCQNEWTSLLENVFNLNGMRRRCGGLLQVIYQIEWCFCPFESSRFIFEGDILVWVVKKTENFHGGYA